MNCEDRLKRFIGEQDNLDTIYWLMKGLSYRKVGEKIGKPHAFVQRKNSFLRNNGLVTGGLWRIDVEAMGMTKKFKFYDRCIGGWPEEVKENDYFLTYFADIKKGKSQHLAIYTFPDEIEPKTGEHISPYYYLIPKFKAPLLENEISLREFMDVYEHENNDNPLPPRGEQIDPDIIHIEIGRYIQLFGDLTHQEFTNKRNGASENKPDINLRKLVRLIREDMKDEGLADSIDVTYDIVRNRYNEMLEKNIIYLGFALEMRRLGYVLSFCWIGNSEIYRIMKAFSHFNVITALAYNHHNRYLLHLQYPIDKENVILKILDQLDLNNETFKALTVHCNRVLPYPYYFDIEREKNK